MSFLSLSQKLTNSPVWQDSMSAGYFQHHPATLDIFKDISIHLCDVKNRSSSISIRDHDNQSRYFTPNHDALRTLTKWSSCVNVNKACDKSETENATQTNESRNTKNFPGVLWKLDYDPT